MCFAHFYIILSLICLLTEIVSSKNSLRIIGGRFEDENEYPYVASLVLVLFSEGKYSLVQFCSASVISPKWSLTAAHCGVSDPMSIQVGPPTIEHNSNASTPNNYTHKVIGVFKHTNFHISNQYLRIRNDVALLSTEEIVLNSYARISSVDYSSLGGQKVKAMGFGIQPEIILNKKYDWDKNKWRYLKSLEAIAIPCDKKIIPRDAPSAAVLCLAPKCGQKLVSACPGDSGGPLIHVSGIIGIASTADVKKCKSSEWNTNTYIAGGYTAISPYVSWIERMIKD